MKKNKIIIALLVLPFALVVINAQQVPFRKGVNLAEWFQSSDVQSIPFSKFTKTDFQQIKSLGCDVIRLPINMHYFTDREPDYKVDPVLFYLLDIVISWAEELDLHLILDNHTTNNLDSTKPDDEKILMKVWSQMAEYYKNSYKNLYYEILVEPHDIDHDVWSDMQRNVINAIRRIDTTHTIIVTPADWSNLPYMDKLPTYEDDNLIYTFHFYEPMLFTHQGSEDLSLQNLYYLPFPYDESKMPECPEEIKPTYLYDSFINYSNEGTEDHVKKILDLAVDFRDSRNVPVYCGEFGTFMFNSDTTSRVHWHKTVSSYLSDNNIPWTLWDYGGGFGLFHLKHYGLFKHDMNLALVNALGFSPPDQSPYTIKPDSNGFMIYTDYLGEKILENSYIKSNIELYDNNQPNNGEYCLKWSNADHYNLVNFDFRPERDLSYLLKNNYALDFMFRGIGSNFSFDLRFTDTKKDTNDHPWWIKYTFEEDDLKFDGKWYHVHIPLNKFEEYGSRDNNNWYEPVGDFDWTDIDNFEIVAEHSAMNSTQRLWFDNIHITNKDTAQVNNSSILSRDRNKILKPITKKAKIIPNPIKGNSVLYINNELNYNYTIVIYNEIGQIQLIDNFSSNSYIIGEKINKRGIYCYLIKNRSFIIDQGKFLRIK